MEKIVNHQKLKKSDVGLSCSQLSVDKEEGVYYRFGSAALCSMLHLRYNRLKGNADKQDCIRHELKTILVKCSDKQHVPPYMQYRDKTFMYFPAVCYFPFICNIDKINVCYSMQMRPL